MNKLSFLKLVSYLQVIYSRINILLRSTTSPPSTKESHHYPNLHQLPRLPALKQSCLISKARNLSRHDYTPSPFICPLLRSYKETPPHYVPGNGNNNLNQQTTHQMNTMTYVTEWTGHDIRITLQMTLIIYFYLNTYISYPPVVHTT